MARSRLPFALLSLSLLSSVTACDADTSEPELELEAVRDGIFVAEPFYAGSDSLDDVAINDAVMLAEIALDHGGVIRFIDEDPGAETPAISLVALEPDDGPSVMQLVRREDATALEVFLAVAPASQPAPALLVLDHELRTADRDVGAAPRELGLTGEQRSTAAWPVVEDDTWGPNCGNAGNWSWDFNLWSLLGTDGRHHSGLVYVDADVDQYGYFGTYDHIWAGVCIHELGVSPTPVSIQRWNGAAYSLVAGSQMWVPRKDRYRYYSYSPNTSPRRIRIHATGGDGIEQNKLMLSAAWVEGDVTP